MKTLKRCSMELISCFILLEMILWLEELNLQSFDRLDKHFNLEDTLFISIWLEQFITHTLEETLFIILTTELLQFMEFISWEFKTMLPIWLWVIQSLLKMLLKQTMWLKITWSLTLDNHGVYWTLIKVLLVCGSLIQITFSEETLSLVQHFMDFGLILKILQQVQVQIQILFQSSQNLENSKTTLHTAPVDMVSEFSTFMLLE